jgi:sodium-coupled neutral amino acid transporter 11
MDKFKRVTNYSTAIAAVSAISMSVAGYWSFTDKTLGNILVRASAPLHPATI